MNTYNGLNQHCIAITIIIIIVIGIAIFYYLAFMDKPCKMVFTNGTALQVYLIIIIWAHGRGVRS